MYITDEIIPNYVLKAFTAVDGYIQKTTLVRVLLYFSEGIGYIVDIQHQHTNGKTWLDDRDPFRSDVLADCLSYYNELLHDEQYYAVNIKK